MEESDDESAWGSELDLRPVLDDTGCGCLGNQGTASFPQSGFQTIPQAFDCELDEGQVLLLQEAAGLSDNDLATNGLKMDGVTYLRQTNVKQLPTLAQLHR
jgi:hypothetical protein